MIFHSCLSLLEGDTITKKIWCITYHLLISVMYHYFNGMFYGSYCWGAWWWWWWWSSSLVLQRSLPSLWLEYDHYDSVSCRYILIPSPDVQNHIAGSHWNMWQVPCYTKAWLSGGVYSSAPLICYRAAWYWNRALAGHLRLAQVACSYTSV